MTQIFKQNKPLALTQLACTAIIFIAFSAGAVQAQTGAVPWSPLPTLGDDGALASSTERRLGDRIARELYRDPDYLDDAVLGEYVQGIWQPLLAAARARGNLSPEMDAHFAWEILLGRDRTVNAFALPGGYLGLHLGLIAVVNTRDELASVLGHELSHVTQRHISRLIAKEGQQTPWMVGAMILGILAASKNADAGNALIVGGQAVSAQNQLNFSRDMEREADRVGFGVMTQAGFEAQGFVSMFEKLQQASRLNDNGAYPYLRSHPLTTERIADMQARQIFAPAGAAAALPSAGHAMVSARARVLANPGIDALQAMAREAQGVTFASLAAPRQAGVLYGAALASSRIRDVAGARNHLNRLVALVKDDATGARLAHLLAIEVALAGGDAAPPEATQRLQAQPGQPERRPELLLAAQAAGAGQVSVGGVASEVAQRLQIWVSEHPRDAQAWQWLATLYTAQGQTLRAIRASAESRVAVLDYAAALDRLKAAQDALRAQRNAAPVAGAPSPQAEHVDASIIDTRRRQVELLLKEQALDR